MTTINVPRELLEFLCSNNNNALSRLPELRALLAEQPQAGAGQDVPALAVRLVPVDPTPEMLEAGDGYMGTPATYKAMLSAAPHGISTEFSQFLAAVMDAAGLVRHGRQSKELSEYLGSQCMKYRLAAAPQPAARHDQVNEVRRLREALKQAEKNERHRNNAETRYWCDQYKQLAKAALTHSKQGAKE